MLYVILHPPSFLYNRVAPRAHERAPNTSQFTVSASTLNSPFNNLSQRRPRPTGDRDFAVCGPVGRRLTGLSGFPGSFAPFSSDAKATGDERLGVPRRQNPVRWRTWMQKDQPEPEQATAKWGERENERTARRDSGGNQRLGGSAATTSRSCARSGSPGGRSLSP